MRCRGRICTALLSCLGLLASLNAGAAGTELTDVVKRAQSMRVHDRPLRYESETGRIAIADVETGEPHGYMYYTAYRLPPRGKTRAVMFIWNGGPGADSSLLHFSAAGPRRAEGGRLLDNEETWLTAADLVFVDPIGTGFSRPTRREYAEEFYSTRGDVASVTEFVRAWLLLHGVVNAPVFLVGESWGSRRAASVAFALLQRHVPVNGLFLISGDWGLSHDYLGAPLRTALSAVDMATTALYYGKSTALAGSSIEQARRTVTQWAKETYAPALSHPDAVTTDERRALVDQLSAYIGVLPGAIDAHTLSVSPGEFRRQLLKDRGQVPYIFDMRRTSPPGRENDAAILHYLRQDIGYRTALPYLGIEELTQGYAPDGNYPASVGERWNYATEKLPEEQVKAAYEAAATRGDGPPKLGAPLPATEEALALNPHLRVLIAEGMFDSFLPCAAGDETKQRLPARITQAIRFRCYVGGHAMYLDAPVRRQVAEDVRTLVRNALAP